MQSKSQKLYSTLIASALVTASVVAPIGSVNAATQSYIEVNNNVGAADTVVFKGVVAKDVVKVYDSKGEKLLGSATATKNGDLTVSLKAQFSEATIQVSLTNYNKLESSKIIADVPDETATTAPDAEMITVANNVGIADTVTVKGLVAKDVVKVYTEDGKTLLGSAVALKAGDVVVSLKAQLTGEKVQVSVTNANSLESEKTEATFAAEKETPTPDGDTITVANNVGIADTVTVKELAIKDVVKVYTEDGKTLLGSAVALKAGDVVVSLKEQLAGDKVQVSVTNANSLESEKTEATIAAEKETTAPEVDTITVANNVGVADTVTVTGLAIKDLVKVYAEDGKTLLGSAVALKAGDVVVSLKAQLTGEKVQVSVTNANSLESEKTEAIIAAEKETPTPEVDTITVANNVGVADTVTVTGLAIKDVVKVYAEDGKTLLGSAVALKAGDVVVSLKAQLTGENVQVSVTNANSLESEKTEATIAAEKETAAPEVDTITVANNVGVADTVTVKNLTAKDVVKVYKVDGVTLLGTATATKDGEIVVSLKAPLDEMKVKVSVTNANSKESPTTEAEVVAEATTPAPVVGTITVANNVGIADTVTVKDLAIKDVVKVYAEDGKTLLGSAVALKAGDVIVSLKAQLTGEKVQVSVTNANSLESEKTEATIAAEEETAAPEVDTIIVANNVGVADTVTVTGLAIKDVVKVYTEDGKTLLGSAVALKAGDVVVSLKAQLTGEKVQVSVTNANSLESEKTEATFAAEKETPTPDGDTITVANNVGIADTVTVKELAIKDVVKV
ncbi:hypothetical protein CSV75_07665, partial [Sporosarcina sp. P18a]|uniref:hypothetical protein n=1 Tax=Sporosarcina sp. P18a TaxID=2048259 RepID=UPI000C1697EF